MSMVRLICKITGRRKHGKGPLCLQIEGPQFSGAEGKKAAYD